MKHKLVLVLILGLGFISCKKDIAGKCDDLAEAMVINNQEKAATIMNSWINELASDEYTEDNINRLISLINDNCTINATLFCFDCVMTLPSQTEIGLEFQYNGNTVNKVLDITYEGSNNRIRYSRFHD